MNDGSAGTTSGKEKRGAYVLVHTGPGKGKTTSALGQILRAHGSGLKGEWISLFKGGREFKRGSFQALSELGIPARNFVPEHPSFGSLGKKEARRGCLKALEYVKERFLQTPDILVFDEINVALRDGLIEREEFLELLRRKPEGTELVLTGRGAPDWLIERADLVSRIENVKHFFQRGGGAREGFEY